MSDVAKELASQLAKDVYNDGMKKSVVPTGNVLSLVPRSINVALSQFDIWLTKKELNIDLTKSLIAEKLKHADPEKIVSPEAYVAIPAIQALSYSMGSEELCNMYANLLAKSMYATSKDHVHPSFVETIKQLSPTDARLFMVIAKEHYLPIVDIRLVEDDSGFRKIATNITGMDDLGNQIVISASINNLEKQGLIKTSDEFFEDESLYLKIFNSSAYKLILSKPIFEKGRYIPAKRLLHITDLGILFSSVCINNSLD